MANILLRDKNIEKNKLKTKISEVLKNFFLWQIGGMDNNFDKNKKILMKNLFRNTQ